MLTQTSWRELQTRKSATFGAWLVGVEQARAKGTVTIEISFPKYVREEERQAFAALVSAQVRGGKTFRELQELQWKVVVDAAGIFPEENSTVLGKRTT